MKNKITLTEHQQEYYDNILGCIEDAVNDKSYCTRIVALNGPAGSGKTTTVSHIINNILGRYTCTVTATTHKALSVLRDMLKLPENIPSRTIHSHLMLRLLVDYNTGEQILVKNKNVSNDNRTQVLFVDESSMVSNQLFEHIKEAINRRLVKVVVFVGDQFQMLPIETGGQNPIYAENFQYNLTEVVRQAQDNPIIKLATIFRKCIETKTFYSLEELKQIIKQHQDNKHIILCKDRNEFFGNYFDKTLLDKKKFICTFTNKAALAYNNLCRAVIKGQDIPSYIPGDEVVFNDAHVVGDEPIHVNNEIVTIKSCELKEFWEVPDIMYWECKDHLGKLFNIVEKSSVYKWNEYLNEKASLAKIEKDGLKRRDAWRDFYDTKGLMQNVSFTYSGTVHKSQGSTYDITYVDVDEIFEAWRYSDTEFIYRLLYVSCTRPSETLVLKISTKNY